MDAKQALQLKNIITGLLISTPLRLTIQQLSKDYKEMEGQSIPFRELGFVNVEDYLRSIPETVNIYGSGPLAEVEAVVTSKSDHINSMVLKQKKSKAVSHKKAFHPVHTKPPSWNHYYSTKKSLINYGKKVLTPVNTGMQESNTLKNECDVRNNSQCCIETQVHFPLEEIIQNHKPTSELNNEIDTQQGNSTFNDLQRDFLKSESCYLETNFNLPDTENSTKLLFNYDNESHSSLQTNYSDVQVENLDFSQDIKFGSSNYVVQPEHTLLSGENYESRIPLKVQKNLKNLMQHFPNGIQCTKLPAEYRKMFKKKLCFDGYGYKSLIDMCSDLPEIIYYVRQSSHDYMLYDKTKPLPVLDVKVSPPKRVQIETVVKTHVLEELPKFDKSASSVLIPSDAFNMSDEISRLFPSDVAVGDLLEISIGEIYDLSKFWIYMTFGELDSFMKQLQDFFLRNHKRYQIPELLLEEGLYCVALYAGQYHRCVIVNLLYTIPNFIRVFYIDYGTVSNVHKDEIWFLPKQFGELPCQAIRARLSNIYPVHENRPWSADAVARFEQLIAHRIVVAEVTRVDEQDHVLEIYLADITNRENIFYINDVFVKEGYALYTDQERKRSHLVDHDCVPNVRYIHLYPEFYEIEAGLAPTTDEMMYINNNKIPLSYFMPQYFDIHYYEDVNGIQLQHEKFNQTRIPEISIPSLEPGEFDFDFFPDCLKDEIRELYQQENTDKFEKSRFETPIKTESCGEGESETDVSVKEYFCNKKRISELIHGSSINIDVYDPKTPCDDSDFSFKSSDSSNQDFMPLNNTLQKLSLENSDFYSRSACTSHASTNPFLNNSGSTSTNPFRASNPFLSDIEETVNKSDLFNEFAKEGNLPQKIVNNLKASSPCTCKVNKQNNIDKCTVGNNSEVLNESVSSTSSINNTASSEKKEMISVVDTSRRVRTPPGFSSTHLQSRPPVESNYNNFYNFVPNNFSNSSYYPNLPFTQFSSNCFSPQNQLYLSMCQPILNGYFNSVPSFCPNQFDFNSSWRQLFSPINNYGCPPPKDK